MLPKIWVSIYNKCKFPALLAKAIYTNSAHQRVWLDIYRYLHLAQIADAF